MSPFTSRVYPGVFVPMPILLSTVSASNNLSVPAAFWIWNEVIELDVFC